METGENETALQETEPTLQLKRSLLPINEYAAREGVSIGIVEQCGRLGIVQIRKYKGKTFVVDVPLSPYSHTPETAVEPVQITDETTQAEKISELFQKVAPEDGTLQGHHFARRPNSRRETQGQAKDSKIGTSDTAETPDKPVESDEPIETIDDEIDQVKNIPVPAQVTRDNGMQLADLVARIKSGCTRQTATVFLTACFFAILFGNLWLYMDRKIQLDRLGRASAGMQQLLSDSTQADRKVEIIRNELTRSKVEVEHLKNELANSKAEIEHLKNELADSKTVRDELAQARQKIETIQQRTSKAAARLNEQIRKLTNRLPGPAENPQPSPNRNLPQN